MPTVELPAHNVGTDDGTHVTIVGGPEALADRDTDSYVRIERGAGEPGEFEFRVGYDGTPTDLLGFGVWEQPAGTTVESMQFVAEGWREGPGAGDVDPDDYNEWIGEDSTTLPVTFYPFVLLRYADDPFPSFGGYNLSTFPLGPTTPGEVVAPGEINLQSYVIAPGGGDRGELGLAPTVTLAWYPFPGEEQAVVLTYLAIRITYTSGEIPPRRIYGRPLPARIYGGGSTVQDGRIYGGIL